MAYPPNLNVNLVYTNTRNCVSPMEMFLPQTQNSFSSHAGKMGDVDWKDAPIRGQIDAPIKIVVFSDFFCPYCASAWDVLDRVLEEYEDRIMIAYMHFPIHGEESIFAAEAAECAREQGKFWEMHHLIFEHAPDLSKESYRTFTQQLYLESEQFEKCLSEHRYRERILNDFQKGKQYGVLGTPTFFINGTMVQGMRDIDWFQQKIKTILHNQDTGDAD